ncbi:hypothetical protein F2Q69_00041337 [Brassica cretica]|uniref:Uncharacterized protein n=1 Tax=Brassica cretica TaxID=69181 RepID=A0A8S9NJ69_BRACR|nr:hypothetical protein F2Q69_00041337 [Brassica cretica]
MSDTHYHGEEISADTYATLRRHQFNLESLAIPLDHRSTLTSQHRSTDSQNSAEEPLIPTVPGNSTGRRRMSMASTEMNRDTPEI